VRHIPPSSQRYNVHIGNETQYPVFIDVSPVNRSFYCRDGWFKRQYEHMGWKRNYEKAIEPHGNAHIVIPSETDCRMGLLLVVARIKDQDIPRTQRIAFFLLRWPWEDSKPLWRDPNNDVGWPAINLTMKESDFVKMSFDEMYGSKTAWDNLQINLINTWKNSDSKQ
jgi:hypothetical protein